jgi:hypothetical protein
LHSTKFKIYISIVKSILTYGAETWSIKRKHRHKLLATEMDYLRHEWTESEMKQLEQQMGMEKDILQEIEEHQLRWYGHVMRMEDCRTAELVAEWNPKGKRRRGRAVSTWKGGIRDSMQRRNIKDKEYFGRELLKKKKYVSWLRKTVYVCVYI